VRLTVIALRGMRRRIFFGLASLALLGIFAGIIGLDYFAEQEFAVIPNQTNSPPMGKVSIVIRIDQRLLEVYDDGQLHKKYSVAVGKRGTPTPIGEWNVVWKDYNWGGGFGTRWIGLNVPYGIYGIHGTNKSWSIGRFASGGCIRMRNRDVEELFEWVPLGTEVRIVGRTVRVNRSLKYQDIGADVVVLQLKLKEAGHLTGRADGLFGLDTEAAVRSYQTAQGLEPTGVVDKELAERLGLWKQGP
jgi:hypothetical protein